MPLELEGAPFWAWRCCITSPTCLRAFPGRLRSVPRSPISGLRRLRRVCGGLGRWWGLTGRSDTPADRLPGRCFGRTLVEALLRNGGGGEGAEAGGEGKVKAAAARGGDGGGRKQGGRRRRWRRRRGVSRQQQRLWVCEGTLYPSWDVNGSEVGGPSGDVAAASSGAGGAGRRGGGRPRPFTAVEPRSPVSSRLSPQTSHPLYATTVRTSVELKKK